MKNLQYYLELPYTVIMRRDEEGDFVARIDELPGCAAHGSTPQEAFEALEEAKELWITDCLESGDPVPEPVTEEALPSGKWVQRVSRTLHQKLVSLAKREHVSLNQLVASILAEAVGVRRADHADHAHRIDEPLHARGCLLASGFKNLETWYNVANLRNAQIELTCQWSNRLGSEVIASLSARRTAGTSLDQGTIIFQPPSEEVMAHG
jgi:antitoxin HicB